MWEIHTKCICVETHTQTFFILGTDRPPHIYRETQNRPPTRLPAFYIGFTIVQQFCRVDQQQSCASTSHYQVYTNRSITENAHFMHTCQWVYVYGLKYAFWNNMIFTMVTRTDHMRTFPWFAGSRQWVHVYELKYAFCNSMIFTIHTSCEPHCIRSTIKQAFSMQPTHGTCAPSANQCA